MACGAISASPAFALTVSPLNGTPDASPSTQISLLGTPADQIVAVHAVGSRSGAHGGRLEPYASGPGASFLPAHPFTQGEQVRVNALVGPPNRRRRIAWSFAVARLVAFPARSSVAGLPAKPGTTQTFVSQPALHPPVCRVTVSSPAAAAGDVFLTPSRGYGQSGTMIIDGSGALVWFMPAPAGEIAEDLQVQSYEGKAVLAWWQGRVVDGIGLGSDQIYSSSYRHLATIVGGNGYQVDLHSLRITPQGSAFVTAYSLVRADLSSAGGSRRGILQDAIVQEIDIKTGLVMFEWHADGHVALSDSYHAPKSAVAPWDYFHANSISLDPSGDGDFLLSSRNTWTAYEINHHTGAIAWRLGGKHSSFHMGSGTGTAWQHDVRWQPDGTITVFDNGAVPKVHSQTRVIHERIDWAHRTVTLIGRAVHTPALLSGSQGDDQILPNGDSFVGWGEEPYLTEFSPTGEVLFDAHLIAPGESYRAYRFPWTATPASTPAIALRAGGPGAVTVYASWNGATDVAQWRVLGGPSPSALSPAAVSPRSGFETAISAPAHAWLAVQALGSAGQVLATSPAKHS